MKAVRINLAVLLFCLLVGCNEQGAAPTTSTPSKAPQDQTKQLPEPPPPLPPGELVSIAVDPGNASIALGTTKQFKAIGIYSDKTTKELTTAVIWTSSDNSVASIAAGGLATSTGLGTTKISATLNTITGSAELLITPAQLVSIGVTPANPAVPLGTSQQFTATGVFSDNSTQDISASVVWKVEDSNLGSISSSGLFQSATTGASKVVASSGEISGSAQVTVTDATLVSLSLTPPGPSIPLGLKQQFAATGVYSDGSTKSLTTQVAWTSADEKIATISNAGLATSMAVGETKIEAEIEGVKGATHLKVTSAALVALEIAPLAPTIAKGYKEQFKAVGTFTDFSTEDMTNSVVWETSDPSIATISNASPTQGLASSVGVGVVKITASSGGISQSTELYVKNAVLTSIAVTPYTQSIHLGSQQQYTATGTYSDNSTEDLTTQVTWSSSNLAMASISNADGSKGLATSLSMGTGIIQAATKDGLTGNASLQVTAAVLTAIHITPSASSITKGSTQAFTAMGTYSDTTTADITAKVTWSSSNESVASISNADGSQGVASALAIGEVKISAQLSGVSASEQLTVTGATLVSINVEPTNGSIAKGTTQQFSATGLYSDNTSNDITNEVTWTVSDEKTVSISNAEGTKGLATGLLVGTVKVFASLDGLSGATELTITEASLTSIELSADLYSVAAGYSAQFSAAGIYSDGSRQDFTETVTWKTSDSLTASISNAAGSKGKVSTYKAGTVTISANFGSFTDSADFTVTGSSLTALTVTPSKTSIAKGLTKQFLATGKYSDGSTRDMTNTVSWSSSNSVVASISNTAGSNGLATGVGIGTTTIKADYGSFSASSTLDVTAAVLRSIDISPKDSSFPAGLKPQFSALGTYSDGSVQNITTNVTWSSSATAIATIGARTGLAKTVAVGTTTIKAALGSVNSTTKLTVNSATLSTITLSLSSFKVTVGGTQNLTATGTYSDSTTFDITALSTWSSASTKIATVTNAAPKGIVKGVKVGSTKIKAAFSGKSVTSDVLVQ